VRLADMVRASGPWHTHSSTWVPRVAAAGDGAHILFSALSKEPGEGATLMVADRHGRWPVRVGSLLASHDPVMSHDGLHVAFRGCSGTPCRGSLWVAALDAPESPIEVPIDEARDFAWSADGTTVYAVGSASKT